MVPTPLRIRSGAHSSRLFVALFHFASQQARRYFFPDDGSHSLYVRETPACECVKEKEPHDTKFIVFASLIPILVLLSGVFAGLTLGYMSLDETQLNVLSISGTPYVSMSQPPMRFSPV